VYDADEAKLAPEGGEFFSIADLARAVRKRAWLVVLVPILAAAGAVGASLLRPPVYEASATVVVGLTRSMVEGVRNAQGDAQGGPDALSARDLGEGLTVEQVEDTRFLSLTYQDGDPNRAQAVANDAARVFVEGAAEANGMAGGAALKVASNAPQPVALEGPNPVRNGLLALALGLMLGVGLAFLLERFGGKS